MVPGNPSLFQAATSNWQKIPKHVWLLALLVGAFSSCIDIAFWALGWSAPLWIAFALVVIAWLAAVYLGATVIVSAMPSLLGYFRFFVTTATLALPLVATGTVLIFTKPLLSQEVRISLLLLGLLSELLIFGFLPAWPMAQSVTARVISPITVFRATRGHRWALIGLTFASGGISNSKIIPRMATATNFSEAALIGLGNALLGLIPFAFAASISGTAWEFAIKNDPSLATNEPTGAEVVKAGHEQHS